MSADDIRKAQRAEEPPVFEEPGSSLQAFTYLTGEEAVAAYSELPEAVKIRMATIYQEAFGGPPWFEVGKCPNCGRFTNTEATPCPICGAMTEEAYPLQELMGVYFPQMLSEFVPGVLIFATDDSGEIVGWTCGGFTMLGELVRVKYNDSQEILASIICEANLAPEVTVFYDNETCIAPNRQGEGIGGRLGQARLEAAKELGAACIVGRTVNEPWLRNKKRILDTAGFSVDTFIPAGDSYQVEGKGRVVYVARQLGGEA